MSSSDIALVLRWIVPLWLLGWAAFPVSRRLFSFLPDQGLALGRVLTLVLGALGAFWLASVHVLPLSVGVCFVPLLALAGAWKWRGVEPKKAVREHLAALIFSDLVFLLAFAFFVWVRLRHPSINDLEKPMDLALLNQSARAQLLPFEHFWFAGVEFSNYYFFGPFMGSSLARLFATPATFAYNLVQPLFCALFLSVLWSLGAALSKSKWLGLGVMLLVGLGGHLEPLRQLSDGTPLGELDWFKTSRVVDRVGDNFYTINEYPAFTLLIGDAHAHFYAFALAVTHFCLCLGIVCVESKRAKQVLIVLGGAMLGAIAITNTWDVPLYGVLWALCVFDAGRKDENRRATRNAAIVGLGLIVIVALPFFARFRSQVGGGGFVLWPGSIAELKKFFPGFALFWGVWIALGVLAFAKKIAPSREGKFRRLLLLIGILALLFPSIYTIGGAFAGSDYKHQDTVFKFYLQAWLLSGTAISSAFLLRLHSSTQGRAMLRIPAWAGVLALGGVLSLAPYAVWQTRTGLPTPGIKALRLGEEGLSLDGAKWLPQSDRKAIEWLREQNGTVAETLPPDGGGDYDANRGTMATHSGLPGVLCWPNSHVRPWGFQNDVTRAAAKRARETGADVKQAQTDAMNAQVDERVRDLGAIFGGDTKTRHELVKKHRISFIVVRPNETRIVDPGFETHEFDGDDGSKTFILERKGF